MAPTTLTQVIVLIVNLEKPVKDLDKLIAGRAETIEGVGTAEAIAYTDFQEPLVPGTRPEPKVA